MESGDAQRENEARVVLSTDDNEIAAVGRQYGLEVPFTASYGSNQSTEGTELSEYGNTTAATRQVRAQIRTPVAIILSPVAATLPASVTFQHSHLASVAVHIDSC